MHRTITALAASVIAGSAAAEEVRVFNWSEYILPGAVEAFEAETGIKVVYDQYESGEVAERHLLAGGSGYDLVVISSEYLGRLVEAGSIAALDDRSLSPGSELMPEITDRLAALDAGTHSVPYLWGTTGIAFDRAAVEARMPDAPTDSWAMIFDPEIVSRFTDCGVSIVDSPEEVLGAALLYLGHDPNTVDPDLIEEASELLMAISPHVNRFDSAQIWDLADGSICLAMGWSTDILYAAEQTEGRVPIEYVLPREGGLVWFDNFAIPSDAPNPDAAWAFVDFLLRPENIAATTEHLFAPNAGQRGTELVDDEVRDDPLVYPGPSEMAALRPILGRSLEQKRRFETVWNTVKLGF